jgi:hypothetical protein
LETFNIEVNDDTLEWKEEILKKTVLKCWVPDNLSKLKKLLNTEKPLTRGLPLCHLYYTTPRKDNDGYFNRKMGGDVELHAKRIIIGLTWNWCVAKLAGMDLSEEDLNNSITIVLCQFTGWKPQYELKWNDMLELDNDTYTHIISIYQNCLDECYHRETNTVFPVSMKDWFEDNIAPVIIQKDAITQFTPLDTQKIAKDKDGKKALQEYQRFFQECRKWNVRVDLTTDYIDWSAPLDETEIRKKCWLSGKQIQRLLTKAGRNSKSKYGRKNGNTRSV